MATPAPIAWQSIGQAATPVLFVLLWSTGFIGAKYGLPFAPPMTFLTLRFAVVTILLAAIAALTRAPWPATRREVGHLALAGLLLQGVYLGGVFASLAEGVDAGISALIVGVQPAVTALLAGPVLGERVTARQWLGFGLGLAGVALVVTNRFGQGHGTAFGYALSVLALIGITVGTLYQKRYVAQADLRSGNVIQFAAATILTLPVAALTETPHIVWTAQFVLALAWLCIVLSLGAITLLYILIRRGAASRVASLFYLVPPVTAVMAWALFGEALGPTVLTGMAMVAIGVALVNVRR